MTYDITRDPKNWRWRRPALKNPKPPPMYSWQVYEPNPNATHRIIYYQKNGKLQVRYEPLSGRPHRQGEVEGRYRGYPLSG